MTLIIVDIEATCDEKSNLNWRRDYMEPIEIGAIAINDKLEIISEFNAFIKPARFPILSDFCKELTTIKQSDVDNALDFKTVYTNFRDWAFQYSNPEFCSWGDYDRNELTRHCNMHKIDFKFEKTCNLKKLFATTQGLSKEAGVGKALNITNQVFTGTPHRGIDDVKNILKLVKYSYLKEKYENNKKRNLKCKI